MINSARASIEGIVRTQSIVVRHTRRLEYLASFSKRHERLGTLVADGHIEQIKGTKSIM